MIISPHPQNSLEWLQARSAVVTASEFDNIVTPEFEARTGEMRQSYMCQKLAEKWMGGSLPGFQSVDMDIGAVLEHEAIPTFTFETGLKATRVGLITNDEGTIGCSPDGLIDEESGIEIKCPRAETHVKYLLKGEVPKAYRAQVHGAMLVTGRSHWYFASYSRRLPMLIVKVERDEEIIESLREKLDAFLKQMEHNFRVLVTKNAGKLPRHLQPDETPAKKAEKPKLHEQELTP